MLGISSTERSNINVQPPRVIDGMKVPLDCPNAHDSISGLVTSIFMSIVDVGAVAIRLESDLS